MTSIRAITVLAMILLMPAAQASDDALHRLPSIADFLKPLLSNQQQGGDLHCGGGAKPRKVHYQSCEQFARFVAQGCYGETTYAIKRRVAYSDLCARIQAVQKSKPASTNYFDLRKDTWWKSIPASIIPVPGGIYSDASFKREKKKRAAMVAGKLLGQIHFVELKSSPSGLDTVISVDKQDCGSVNDTFSLKPVLLADFTGDGIAELLVQGYRANSSEKCFLGTGNSLGASFTALLGRTSKNGKITILHLP